MCVCVCTSCHAASGHLPDDESVAVDVSHDVGLELILVQALVQNLGGHVAPRPNTRAQRDVHFIGVAMVTGRRASAAVYLILSLSFFFFTVLFLSGQPSPLPLSSRLTMSKCLLSGLPGLSLYLQTSIKRSPVPPQRTQPSSSLLLVPLPHKLPSYHPSANLHPPLQVLLHLLILQTTESPANAMETPNLVCPSPQQQEVSIGIRYEEAPVKLDGQAQVSDAAGSVLLDQDVLALQVSVGDGGLPLRAVDFRVKVTEAARHRVG